MEPGRVSEGPSQPNFRRGVAATMSYLADMRRWTLVAALGCGFSGLAVRAVVPSDAAAALPGVPVVAEAPANPYIVITNRNAFGIKPPAPPAEPVPVAPAVVPPNLFLTGISHLRGLKRAYLVVNRPNGKTPDYLSVDEGYDVDGLKVLGIDHKKQTVRVMNSGTELTLNFKDHGMKGAPAPPPGPGQKPAQGGMPAPGLPVPPAPAYTAAPFTGGATIIGRGGVVADNTGTTATAYGGAEAAPVRQVPARRGIYVAGQNGGVPQEQPVGHIVPPSAITVPAVPGPVSNPGASSGRLPPPPIPGAR